MIGRRMANIIKRLARYRDDMRLAHFQRVRRLDAEWKFLRCPTEYCLPNLTPPWAQRRVRRDVSKLRSSQIALGIPRQQEPLATPVDLEILALPHKGFHRFIRTRVWPYFKPMMTNAIFNY